MRVVVIGSGIVGAGAAYYLSCQGAEVTVVDGGYQGEATQAGAGIVCPWVDHSEDDDWYRLTREGARAYPELVEELGEDIGYAEVGALLVAEDPADLEPVRGLLRRRHPAAPEMGDIIDVSTPSELFPPLSDALSAILVPGAARVDGRSVRDALLQAAIARGARVITGTATLTPGGEVLVGPVSQGTGNGRGPAGRGASGDRGPLVTGDTTSWRQAAPLDHDAATGAGSGGTAGIPAASGSPDTTGNAGSTGNLGSVGSPESGPGVQGGPERAAEMAEGRAGDLQVGDGARLDADMVIVAAGAWTGEVCRPLGVELPVFPRRGQILHATLEGVDTAWWPMVLPRIGPYLLGFPDSRIVIGATVEDVGFAPRITMGGLDEVIEAGLRVAPGLVNATVSEVRVGLRPVYAPGPALIGPLTDRVVVATGLSAYGLTAGPFTGLIAAALALGETPPIDITPYAPRPV
ncbi:FAD-dependent oxidoreductase [Nonomuraea sp. NPDC050643]|uniref:NAD(P)/FAD-dependent oxidoreductase n=1 Tax=Nonomuraea sp. NPDC050643 TaxID=3155660 RepID=UPI0033F35AC8